MLADEVVVVMISMFVRTKVPQRAETLAVCLTDWSVGIEAEAVFAFEKVGEGELIGWRLSELVGSLVI